MTDRIICHFHGIHPDRTKPTSWEEWVISTEPSHLPAYHSEVIEYITTQNVPYNKWNMWVVGSPSNAKINLGGITSLFKDMTFYDLEFGKIAFCHILYAFGWTPKALVSYIPELANFIFPHEHINNFIDMRPISTELIEKKQTDPCELYRRAEIFHVDNMPWPHTAMFAGLQYQETEDSSNSSFSSDEGYPLRDSANDVLLSPTPEDSSSSDAPDWPYPYRFGDWPYVPDDLDWPLLNYMQN